jgi:hypothetical protein
MHVLQHELTGVNFRKPNNRNLLHELGRLCCLLFLCCLILPVNKYHIGTFFQVIKLKYLNDIKIYFHLQLTLF